jgi:D-3-phosphoglycerate dehydrogenase / 2-oxoglutarate reductase
MSFRVVMTVDYGGIDEFIARHKTEFYKMGAEYTFRPCHTEDEVIAAAHEADALITVSFMQPITRKIMENLTQCRLIQSEGAGIEGVDIKTATELGICVANSPDYCTEEVSDHAMALILACSRQVVRINNAVKAGKWLPATIDAEIRSEIWPKLARLRGKTLGFVGLGRIPRALLPKVQAFGMRVIAFDPKVTSESVRQLGVELVELNRLFQESDFITIHAALTDETKHMIGQGQFNSMKRTAWLINTARGPVVDESALCDALRAGKLAGAALDVTDPEPIASNSPLLKMDNVIITAHVGAISPESWAEFWLRPIDEIGRIMRGEWPRCLVNPEVKERFMQKWGPMK